MKINQLIWRSKNELIDSIYVNVSNFLKIEHQNWSNYNEQKRMKDIWRKKL